MLLLILTSCLWSRKQPSTLLNPCSSSVLLSFQVSLKFPDVLVTLPIHIGNVSLDKKRQPSIKAALAAPASASTPDLAISSQTHTFPSEPAVLPFPRPIPRVRLSPHSLPSAPPAPEYPNGAEGGSAFDDGFPNKRQSQLVSPSAFSYVPGLVFPNNPSGSVTPSSVFGASAPYPTEGANSTPIPLPRYSAASSPQGQFS